MHQNTFGGLAPPAARTRWGSLCTPDPLAAMGAYCTSVGREGRGLLVRRMEGRKGRKEGT